MTDHITDVALLATSKAHSTELLPLDTQEEKSQSAATPITLKCGDAFLVADTHGDFRLSRKDMGLYRHGTRFLHTCNVFLEGQHPFALSHQVAAMGDACNIDLTNAPLQVGQHALEQGTIHIQRLIELEQDSLSQRFTLTSFHPVPLPLTLTLLLGADFRDLFEARGMIRTHHGEQLPTQRDANGVTLRYRGRDRIERITRIQFSSTPTHVHSDRVDWHLLCQPGIAITITITVTLNETGAEKLETRPAVRLWRDQEQVLPTLETDNAFFNRLLTHGMQDLMMLSTMTPHGYYPYAGIPWYNCPFGRDGLITALQFLPLFPQVARGTLKFLAAYQGTKVDEFTEEEPGKILHEFRTGEMANCREIPYIPYYGTVDATPLFLILLDGYIRWSNDLALLENLWPNAEAAARWMLEYGDRDGDSFLEFHRTSEKGLAIQSWKDSWDSTSHSNGQLATSPLAHCEVQGYAYAAFRAMATLARRLGKTTEAPRWDHHADTLQANFLRSFWWEQEQCFYMALADQKVPCDIVTSNAGQCLWTGIVPETQAFQVVQRLMREDMFSGWGIRTLSSHARRYNPMSYHNGSVWPHDTALIGAGFAHTGAKREAGKVLKSLFDASTYFEHARLPELYCGFPRRDGYGPTRYPVSCSPQAWAAGAPFVMVSALLGLEPDAEHNRLSLRKPTLPEWLTTLELKGLYVGNQRVHLRFVRDNERTEVVLGRDNEVDVRVIT